MPLRVDCHGTLRCCSSRPDAGQCLRFCRPAELLCQQPAAVLAGELLGCNLQQAEFGMASLYAAAAAAAFACWLHWCLHVALFCVDCCMKAAAADHFFRQWSTAADAASSRSMLKALTTHALWQSTGMKSLVECKAGRGSTTDSS